MTSRTARPSRGSAPRTADGAQERARAPGAEEDRKENARVAESPEEPPRQPEPDRPGEALLVGRHLAGIEGGQGDHAEAGDHEGGDPLDLADPAATAPPSCGRGEACRRSTSVTGIRPPG